jgi:hypothetical protein
MRTSLNRNGGDDETRTQVKDFLGPMNKRFLYARHANRTQFEPNSPILF